MKLTRRRWVGLGAIVVVLAAVVAFGVFGVHTLFFDNVVDEQGPTFESGATSTTSPSVVTRPTVSSPSDAGVATTSPPPIATTAPTPVSQVREAGRGMFVDRSHPGTGTVVILTDGSQSFVRFEDDFATDNGPDLYVTVTVGDQQIELGRLRGNVGAQNYELPADLGPDSVEAVSVWCKRFDVTFTSAMV